MLGCAARWQTDLNLKPQRFREVSGADPEDGWGKRSGVLKLLLLVSFVFDLGPMDWELSGSSLSTWWVLMTGGVIKLRLSAF